MNSSRNLLVALALLATLPASAQNARMFVGSWGPDGARQGRVFRYAGGTAWTEVSPPGGLADAVWDLEWIGDRLWVATHDGPPANGFDPTNEPHGTSGRVFSWDGTAWEDMSPPGGFGSAATTVTVARGVPYVTIDQDGLFRHVGGNSWIQVGGFRLAGQAIVSSTHDGRPMIYMGQDNIDEFWMHDPDGFVPCGDPGVDPVTGLPKCDVPTGDVCSADCHLGSCIHGMTDFDDGSASGSLVYGGAFFGRVYSWDRTTRLFVRRDDVPLTLALPMENNHIQGLASYHSLLWAGISNGVIWASPDATQATWTEAQDFGVDQPISDLLAVPEDDLLWAGFGGVPYRWARHDGTARVMTYDGSTWLERSSTSQFHEGVLAQLAVVPEVHCDAGPEQSFDCDGGPVAVTLDGSASSVPGALGLTLSATWSGPFVEGTAAGLNPTVHFVGSGDFTVTLHVEAGSASADCTTVIHIRDTAPPAFAVRGRCLWPPNHRYRCFTIADFVEGSLLTALDACEGEVAIRFVGARSSQPEDETGSGDGHTQDDILFDDDSVCVRSERQGVDMRGRDYEITLSSTDGAGNATTLTATLHVPHDQREADRCEGRPVDTGLLPHDPLPLDPPVNEGTYPDPLRPPRR